MGAKSKPTETLTLAEIGAEAELVGTAGSRTTVLSLAPPQAKGDQVKEPDEMSLREMRRYREAIAVAEEGLQRMPDAVLAQWATEIEDELVAAEKERC